MSITYEKHGAETIEWLLEYLSAGGADQIDGDDYEIIGEDEQGREGGSDISISGLAGEAAKAIRDLAQREKALAAHVESINEWLKAVARDFDTPEATVLVGQDANRFLAMSPATSLAHLVAEEQRSAYLAGWMASGEGSNGEHPGDDHLSPKWLDAREEWIRRQAEGGE